MRINTNVSSLNTQRLLNQTTDQANKLIGQLSSGLRINNASDDAAGLGISNKLGNDIRSLQQAARNADQANSMLQIAQGATQTIASILDRMKELAAQSASSNSGSRTDLNNEFTALRSEIDRIVSTTNYQGTTLINGGMGTSVTGTTLVGADVQSSSVQSTGASAATYTIAKVDATHLSATNGTTGDVEVVAVNQTNAGSSQTVNFKKSGLTFATAASFDASAFTTGTITVSAAVNAGQFLVSSSGAYSGNDNVNLTTAINLGSTALGIGGSSLTTASSAQTALANLDTAVGNVNTALATIGQTQNRIGFALQNTNSTIQNYQAAQSSIRDADMAAAMSDFTKTQILQQAGTAMLAQANSAPQLVLKLLG